MTAARIEKVYQDRIAAREFLAQAVTILGDADATGLSAPSRSILLHSAAVSACDAILQAVGQRVTVGDGAHMLRLQTALEHLDGDTEDLLERLDASRARRNEASYQAAFVAQASLEEARAATAELVALTRDFLGSG